MSKELLKLALIDPAKARNKIAYSRKKRAAMIKEAPFKNEYPLTKRVKQAGKLMDNSTARKAALAAALFPWSLAIGGGAYMLGKANSDS